MTRRLIQLFSLRSLPSLRARTVSSATAPREEREADSVDRLECIQMLHTESDHVRGDGLACLTDEEETREDFDYPCEDPHSPLPPSSSPPQLFSSSPYASSQSSASGTEPSKMVIIS
ncbi:hypothetical protein J3R82DRAFT_4519 [Butyriboletus roseoflavus]|nr:hypothetical protein J3R82DRAFT_4519 [Butyriboletus roseoflavus]